MAAISRGQLVLGGWKDKTSLTVSRPFLPRQPIGLVGGYIGIAIVGHVTCPQVLASCISLWVDSWRTPNF